MLYFISGLVVLIGVAYFFRRKIDLRKRDEYSTKYSIDDGIAQQHLSQINQNHYNHF